VFKVVNVATGLKLTADGPDANVSLLADADDPTQKW
jgi:hypothetical protein